MEYTFRITGARSIADRLLKLAVGAFFAISATLKLADFERTAAFLSESLQMGAGIAAVVLSIAIVIETAAAVITFFGIHRRSLFRLLVLMMVFFTVYTVAAWIAGSANCGCMGTEYQTSPPLSIAKNILIIIAIRRVYHTSIRVDSQ